MADIGQCVRILPWQGGEEGSSRTVVFATAGGGGGGTWGERESRRVEVISLSHPSTRCQARFYTE